MADEVVARPQRLGDSDGPSLVGVPRLVPRGTCSNVPGHLFIAVPVSAVVEARLVNLEPDLVVARLKVFAGPVARRHVRQQGSQAVDPVIPRPGALHGGSRLVLPGCRHFGRLVDVVRADGRQVADGDVLPSSDGGVEGRVRRGQRVAAVAREPGVVDGLDGVGPPAALDGLGGLLILEPKGEVADAALARETGHGYGRLARHIWHCQ